MTNHFICNAKSRRNIISFAVLAILNTPAALALGSSTPSTTGSIVVAPVKILLGTFYRRENGCHSSAKTTTITVSNAENRKTTASTFGTACNLWKSGRNR